MASADQPLNSILLLEAKGFDCSFHSLSLKMLPKSFPADFDPFLIS